MNSVFQPTANCQKTNCLTGRVHPKICEMPEVSIRCSRYNSRGNPLVPEFPQPPAGDPTLASVSIVAGLNLRFLNPGSLPVGSDRSRSSRQPRYPLFQLYASLPEGSQGVGARRGGRGEVVTRYGYCRPLAVIHFP